MSLAEKTAWRWFKLSEFNELGLNNGGRLLAKKNCKAKVFRKPFHQLPRPAVGLKNAKLIEEQQKNKLSPRMTCSSGPEFRT